MTQDPLAEIMSMMVEAGVITLSQQDYDQAERKLAMIHTGTKAAIRAATSVDRPTNLLHFGIENLDNDNPIKQGVACHLLDIIQDFLKRQLEEDGPEEFWKHFTISTDSVIKESYKGFQEKYDPRAKQSNSDGSSEPSQAS